MSDRLAVRKTYKLYLGGAFPRSESGRTYEVTDTKGNQADPLFHLPPQSSIMRSGACHLASAAA